jgi:transglutaminase-like putative cysteine protease
LEAKQNGLKQTASIKPSINGLRMLARLQSLPRDCRDTLFLLAVVAWILLPQLEHLPLWCSVMAAGMLLWRGRLALTAQALPGKLWLLGLLAITLGATLLTHNTLLGRDAGVTLLVMLLALKTMELRARRDAFVIFFLGFFTMLTNFFYSQSLATAFSMLLGLLGLLTALVNAHMPVGKPPLREAAKTAGKMALFGAPVMLVLFVLFPRIAPLWGLPSDAMSGRSGLSANMQVGNIAKLALDSSVAMRIRFDGNTPLPGDLYFRGPVLSRFDGREWSPAGSGFPSRYRLAPNLSVAGAPISYEVTLEPTSRPWLLLLDAANEAPTTPGYRTRMNNELQWLTDRPISDLLRYTAQSYPVFRHGPIQREIGLQEFLELPPGFNPRTLALAAEIRRDPRYAQADSAALVQVALQRLRTGGYSYTLEPGVYGDNTADEFWFDRKQGFCEHIASAFVVLMRAMDIPSRIVTGYQGGERNPVDGLWTIRQSDAHAWVEVWQAGQGWQRVDPTAAVAPGRTSAFERLQAPQSLAGRAMGAFSPTLAAQLRATWEAVNNRWNQWILNYSQYKQLDLLKNMGFQSPSWEDLSYVLLTLIVLVSLAGAAWTFWERSQHDPWLRLLARARKKLDKHGIPSHSASSPRHLALQVLQHHGEAGRPVHDWLMQLEAQRYAASDNGAQPLSGLKKHYRQLRWPA